MYSYNIALWKRCIFFNYKIKFFSGFAILNFYFRKKNRITYIGFQH